MSLRNISNFFNIIKKGRLKSQLTDNDMIPVGTRDVTNKSVYQDTAISFKDLETQLGGAGGVGPQGPPGANGISATITVGTTTTGAAGTSATVTNVGNASAAEFEFVIPEGNPGVAGPPGPVGAAGLNFTGTWSASSAYVVDDVAFFGGSSYVCTSPVGPSATDPSVDTANWAFLALQGLQGIQGNPGIQGPAGPQGPNAWGPAVAKDVPLDNPIDLLGGKTFLINVTADTTLDVINPSIGDYTFIIDNSVGAVVTLQTSSIFYTNNSLQPIISGITMMKLFYDGSKMFVTSLENMQLI